MVNPRPIPSLIIGLGGTGVQVVTYVKKELFELTARSSLPPGVAIFALDTERTPQFKVDGWGYPIVLRDEEYVCIGGSVDDDAHGVAAGYQPYLGKWWNVQMDSNDNLPSDWANLNLSAKQNRQFGRLGLFKNLSSVLWSINNAILAVKRGAVGANELYVHIVGSFVGGTGSGIFVDIAHLVSVLARQAGITQISVRGYFVLADAFLGIAQMGLGDPAKRSAMQAQVYACLRECNRFMVATDWATGYPMYYAETGDEQVLRGRMLRRPYDVAYLFDGHRNRNELFFLPIEHGIAPTIADAIVAHVDTKSGNTFVAHTINSDKQRVAFHISEDIPTYGALGTFTIVLPVFHIIEEWSHRLAKEVLDEFLVPTKWDQCTGIPILPLASNKPGEISGLPIGGGAEQGREWLSKSAPTRFIRDLGDLGERHSRTGLEKSVETELQMRSAETWIKLLVPDGVGDELRERIDRATRTWDSDLTKEKIVVGRQTLWNENYINPNPGGNDREKVKRILKGVHEQFDRLVGNEDEDTGYRSGGRVKSTLNDLKAIHANLFQTQLCANLEKQLNGQEGSDPRIAKSGKLGFMIGYLTQVLDDLRQAQSVLERTEGGASHRRRRNKRHDLAEAELIVAEDNLNHSSGFLGANRKSYIAVAQDFLQVLKCEIAERAARETIEELVQIAENALTEIATWAESLGARLVQDGGLYARILEMREDNAQVRACSEMIKVRYHINDAEYEENKYLEYLARGGQLSAPVQLANVLNELTWNVRLDSTGTIRIGLKLGEKDLSYETRQTVGETNANLLIERCRSVFESAWNDMSIMGYLIAKYVYDISTLANLIYSHSGPLLNVRRDLVLSANFLRVHYENVRQLGAANEQDAQLQKGFLTQLVNELTKLNKVQTTWDNNEIAVTKFADFTDSSDPFKLSFVFFSELNQLRDISAYIGAEHDYRSLPPKYKTHLHVFPAEQHAVSCEWQLPRMNPPQRTRELEPRIVVQLEDMDSFKLATRCLAYGDPNYEWPNESDMGLLLHKTIPSAIPQERNPNMQSLYRLTVEPLGEIREGLMVDPLTAEPSKPKHWDLTDLAREPSFLEAINQFSYRRHAFVNLEDVIDDSRVLATLEHAIEMDCARRVKNHLLGWHAPAGWGREKTKDAEKQVAQYLKYQEVLAIWQRELQQFFRDAIAPSSALREIAPDVQRYADLCTMRVLVLLEEIHALNEQIKQYGGTWLAAPATPRLIPDSNAIPVPRSVDDEGIELVPVEMRHCPHCGELHPDTWKVCPTTGESIPTDH